MACCRIPCGVDYLRTGSCTARFFLFNIAHIVRVALLASLGMLTGCDALRGALHGRASWPFLLLLLFLLCRSSIWNRYRVDGGVGGEVRAPADRPAEIQSVSRSGLCGAPRIVPTHTHPLPPPSGCPRGGSAEAPKPARDQNGAFRGSRKIHAMRSKHLGNAPE